MKQFHADNIDPFEMMPSKFSNIDASLTIQAILQQVFQSTPMYGVANISDKYWEKV